MSKISVVRRKNRESVWTIVDLEAWEQERLREIQVAEYLVLAADQARRNATTIGPSTRAGLLGGIFGGVW